jgi:hypothetical protein
MGALSEIVKANNAVGIDRSMEMIARLDAAPSIGGRFPIARSIRWYGSDI